MTILRLAQQVLLAILVTGAVGYFLWVEIPQFLFFKSTQARVEHVDPVCFLSKEGQSSAADCASVRARAGKSRVYQMYRTTLRYQSPSDDREHIETILTRALGPLRPGATWKVLAHTSEANRVQPANEGGRAILFGVSVLLFVSWLRGMVRRYIRRSIQGAQGPLTATSGMLGTRGWLFGAIAVAFLFFVFTRSIRP
jgi:hypothetical protein